MCVLDIVMSFPSLLLVLPIIAVTPLSLAKTAVAIGIPFVPPVAPVTRSVALDLMSREFMLAAQARGERVSYILLRELLPNAWPAIVVEGSLRAAFAILLGAVLGFGVQPPAADWGLMIATARDFVEAAPWMAIAPGLAMSLTVITVNVLGDGLREYLDPKARRPSVNPLLELGDLTVRYHTDRGELTAAREVSFALNAGQALGLVGESGSGKTTIAAAILDLLGSGSSIDGQILFEGTDLRGLAAKARRRLLGRRVGAVFQHPFTALNPAMTVGRQIAEPLIRHLGMTHRAAWGRASELLADMYIDRPHEIAAAYPHQLSGGMRQRALIAAAMACEPPLLILDEPTTALDVTVEAQILALLADLRRRKSVSLLFDQPQSRSGAAGLRQSRRALRQSGRRNGARRGGAGTTAASLYQGPAGVVAAARSGRAGGAAADDRRPHGEPGLDAGRMLFSSALPVYRNELP
jgi:ABC-type dipeptide/oligopeptide/nickel transport system ATPase subunit